MKITRRELSESLLEILDKIVSNESELKKKEDKTIVDAHTSNEDIHVTKIEKDSWDAKYSKSSTGIPKSDLNSAIQSSLSKADSALQSVPNASTTTAGIVKLNDTVTSTSTTESATANAVKIAMDRANQAFQQANDGKTAVANAVTAKGVSASPADTFATLASKIGQIPTGVKWASGTSSGTTITVSGLDFNPRVILAVANLDSTSQGTNVALYNRLFNDKVLTVYVSGTSFTNYYEMGTSTSSTYYSIFGGFRINTQNSGTIKWIAFE